MCVCFVSWTGPIKRSSLRSHLVAIADEDSTLESTALGTLSRDELLQAPPPLPPPLYPPP